MELEGSWDTTGLILGCDIDTVAETIAVHRPKVEGARTYLLSNEFVVGSQRLSLKALQTLRGYMQHWLAASMFWASCVQPIDFLLTYGSADCVTANCTNFQIWIGYWDMVTLLQSLGRDETARPTLFQNTLIRTISIRRRFSAPRVIEEARWITTDATPSIIGAVDWRARTSLRVDAGGTTKDYVDSDGFQDGIADIELMGVVLGSVDGLPAHPRGRLIHRRG